MTGISYLIIHSLALVLPGWIIVRITGFEIGRLIFVFASSYIYFALLAALAKWLHLPLPTFYIVYTLPLIILAGFSLWIHPGTRCCQGNSYWLSGIFIVVIVYLLYRVLIGPYTEVPGDLFRHLEFTRKQFSAIDEGFLGSQQSIIQLIKQKGGIWYSFYALITSYTGLAVDQTLPWATLANSLVFLSVVYSFAWYIFDHFTLSDKTRLAASLLATLFMASHLGTSVFAYLRYYAFAPTMLNMVIYFASIIAVLELLKWRVLRVRYVLFIICALLASIVVHIQEGLFVVIIGGLMLGWFALYPATRNSEPVMQVRHTSSTIYRVLLILFILGFFVLVIWAYTSQGRPDLVQNKVLQLSQQGPIFNRILFLNPSHQGIQVITLWGLFVYVIFIIYWRKFIGHPYLFAGMLVPFFTVFNPIFVDWFLRMDGVHTLWRMLYITPLHFVAALLVIFLFSSAKSAATVWRKSLAYLSITLLFALLLPLSGINPNSRQTLAKVDHNDSYVYWQDMIDYLNQEQKSPLSILTDPVTAYLIKGLTRHRTYHFKFQDSGRHPFNFEDYSHAPLKKYRGWILILNDRNGGYSETGHQSRHWPADILDTSQFYSATLREHIKLNPGARFEEIWVQGNIHIYKIN